MKVNLRLRKRQYRQLLQGRIEILPEFLASSKEVSLSLVEYTLWTILYDSWHFFVHS